jgi:cytochrome c2
VKALWLLLVAAPLSAGVDGGPGGEPSLGRQTFAEKNCTSCHSVWGNGGRLGPEMTTAVAGKTWGDLVGDFWNHTPRMIEEVSETGHAWPTLDRGEMANLLSYLYYLRLFDEPGDSGRGQATFARHQCGSCHSLGGVGSGPTLDQFSRHASPAPLAQAMWNAGPEMQAEQMRRGRPLPSFVRSEMADIQAYIRAEGLRVGRDVELRPLPNPSRGAEVFEGKRCDRCHGGDDSESPDITLSALSMTFSEITGLLWNHSYAMSEEMKARGIAFPRFVDDEMTDLIAYLYFLGYLGQSGDVEQGAAVFERKGCASCHEGNTEGVPDLATELAKLDEAGLAAAMWNHAPEMHELMGERSVVWPTFEAGEMRDLAAYLRGIGSAAAEEE